MHAARLDAITGKGTQGRRRAYADPGHDLTGCHTRVCTAEDPATPTEPMDYRLRTPEGRGAYKRRPDIEGVHASVEDVIGLHPLLHARPGPWLPASSSCLPQPGTGRGGFLGGRYQHAR